jgi:hypothetical protein
MAFLDRLRRRDATGAAVPAPPVRRRPPTPGQVRRERRALIRAREVRIRDVGGLLLEMYKRDRLRPELVYDQCAEIVSLEDRIAELDAALASLTRRSSGARCTCGAPLVWGAHFCANCGRPAGEAVVACAHCGHPLPAEASFCANCGRAAEAAEPAAPPPHANGQATLAGEPRSGAEGP